MANKNRKRNRPRRLRKKMGGQAAQGSGRQHDPFWKGAETEDELEREKFFDLLAQVDRSPSRQEFEENDYFLVYKMAQLGLSNDDMAFLIGMSPEVFRRLKKQDQRMQDAMEGGKSMAHFVIAERLQSLVMKGNVAATIFACKTRLGWSQRRVVELEDKVNREGGDAKALLEHLTDDELRQFQELMERAQRRQGSSNLLEGEFSDVSGEEDGDAD